MTTALKKLLLTGVAISSVAVAAWSEERLDESRPITVASYYFGNYHPGDPRNAKMKGKDWSEW